MFDAAGSVGPRAWSALLLRRRTERWAKRIIRDVRRRRLSVANASAIAVIASHRGEHGQFLSVSEAAVELINVLRPTVAVSRSITFAALALHEHPAARETLLKSSASGEYTG